MTRGRTVLIIAGGLTVLLTHVSQFQNATEVVWPWSNARWSSIVYQDVLFPNRSAIAFALSALIGLCGLSREWFDSIKPRLIGAVAEISIEDIFEKRFSSHRITIYREVSGIYAFWHHIYWCFLKNFRAHYRKKLISHYLRSFPSIFRKYLVCYARSGHPHTQGSSTRFLVANSETEIDGFTSFVFFEKSPKKQELPKLRVEELSPYLTEESIIDEDLRKRVRLHLHEGRVGCYQRLRSMHRIPTSIWASPILGKDEEFWGVLVMDCFTDTHLPVKVNSFQNQIITNVRIIEKVLKE